MQKKIISITLVLILIVCASLYNNVEAANNTLNSKNNAVLEPKTQKSIIKDRPSVIKTIPSDGEKYFEPELLYMKFPTSTPDKYESGYYIKAVFDDIGSTLKLKTTKANGITVNIDGDSENLVNTYKELKFTKNNLTKEFTIYIPLIDKLKDNQKYKVFIPEITFVDYSDIDTGGNRAYGWTFETNYYPKAERLYEGTVPERYDWNYPIAIDGSMFHFNTKVRFRDMKGEFHNPGSVLMKDNNSLYIYLPRNPRLPIGIYDIIISNGTTYETDMIYGVFSVVAQGDYIPNEGYRIKYESSLGTVKEIIDLSKNTLNLNQRQTNRAYLEINLDELMGSETWVRSIEYPVSRGDNIEELVIKSKWTNIAIENLTLHDDADERYIELRAGRVEPSMADILKKKLIGSNIKSNFIEVSGENFDFDKIRIELPYNGHISVVSKVTENVGDYPINKYQLKLLRYDEISRRFYEVDYYIDLVDGKVIGYTSKPGIFVIVE